MAAPGPSPKGRPCSARTPSLSADTADAQSIAAAADKVTWHWGPVDVLVNSAGIAGSGPLSELSAAEWQRLSSGPCPCLRLACQRPLVVCHGEEIAVDGGLTQASCTTCSGSTIEKDDLMTIKKGS